MDEQHHSQVARPIPGGRFAGLCIVLGLLLLLGGAIAYLFRNAAPMAPGRAARDTPRQLTSSAFDQILNSGQKLVNEGKLAEAQALYKEVLASHPEAQAVHIEFGRLLASQKHAADAYRQYTSAIAIGPVEPEVLLEAGTAASMSGQYERAVEHYSAAQTAAPTDYRPPLFLGQALLKLNRTDEAKAVLLRSAELKPDAAGPTWATLAEVALREDKPDIALNYITHARELDGRSTLYRVIQARAFKRKNDPQAALQQLIGLDEAQQREPGVMQVMSECFGLLNRPADAARMYADASDREPSNGDWAFQAAVWLEKTGDKARALQYAQRAAIFKVEGAAAMAARLK